MKKITYLTVFFALFATVPSHGSIEKAAVLVEYLQISNLQSNLLINNSYEFQNLFRGNPLNKSFEVTSNPPLGQFGPEMNTKYTVIDVKCSHSLQWKEFKRFANLIDSQIVIKAQDISYDSNDRFNENNITRPHFKGLQILATGKLGKIRSCDFSVTYSPSEEWRFME